MPQETQILNPQDEIKLPSNQETLNLQDLTEQKKLDLCKVEESVPQDAKESPEDAKFMETQSQSKLAEGQVREDDHYHESNLPNTQSNEELVQFLQLNEYLIKRNPEEGYNAIKKIVSEKVQSQVNQQDSQKHCLPILYKSMLSKWIEGLLLICPHGQLYNIELVKVVIFRLSQELIYLENLEEQNDQVQSESRWINERLGNLIKFHELSKMIHPFYCINQMCATRANWVDNCSTFGNQSYPKIISNTNPCKTLSLPPINYVEITRLLEINLIHGNMIQFLHELIDQELLSCKTSYQAQKEHLLSANRRSISKIWLKKFQQDQMISVPDHDDEIEDQLAQFTDDQQISMTLNPIIFKNFKQNEAERQLNNEWHSGFTQQFDKEQFHNHLEFFFTDLNNSFYRIENYIPIFSHLSKNNTELGQKMQYQLFPGQIPMTQDVNDECNLLGISNEASPLNLDLYGRIVPQIYYQNDTCLMNDAHDLRDMYFYAQEFPCKRICYPSRQTSLFCDNFTNQTISFSQRDVNEDLTTEQTNAVMPPSKIIQIELINQPQQEVAQPSNELANTELTDILQNLQAQINGFSFQLEPKVLDSGKYEILIKMLIKFFSKKHEGLAMHHRPDVKCKCFLRLMRKYYKKISKFDLRLRKRSSNDPADWRKVAQIMAQNIISEVRPISLQVYFDETLVADSILALLMEDKQSQGILIEEKKRDKKGAEKASKFTVPEIQEFSEKGINKNIQMFLDTISKLFKKYSVENMMQFNENPLLFLLLESFTKQLRMVMEQQAQVQRIQLQKFAKEFNEIRPSSQSSSQLCDLRADEEILLEGQKILFTNPSSKKSNKKSQRQQQEISILDNVKQFPREQFQLLYQLVIYMDNSIQQTKSRRRGEEVEELKEDILDDTRDLTNLASNMPIPPKKRGQKKDIFKVERISRQPTVNTQTKVTTSALKNKGPAICNWADFNSLKK